MGKTQATSAIMHIETLMRTIDHSWKSVLLTASFSVPTTWFNFYLDNAQKRRKKVHIFLGSSVCRPVPRRQKSLKRLNAKGITRVGLGLKRVYTSQRRRDREYLGRSGEGSRAQVG